MRQETYRRVKEWNIGKARPFHIDHRAHHSVPSPCSACQLSACKHNEKLPNRRPCAWLTHASTKRCRTFPKGQHDLRRVTFEYENDLKGAHISALFSIAVFCGHPNAPDARLKSGMAPPAAPMDVHGKTLRADGWTIQPDLPFSGYYVVAPAVTLDLHGRRRPR